MNFNELKYENDFKKWLPKEFVSKANYVAGLKRLQTKLNSDIEMLLNDGIENIIGKITPELFDNNLAIAQNSISYIKKYNSFLNEKFKKVPFKRKEEFKSWLINNGVASSVDSYVSHINGIQRKFNIDVEEFLAQGLISALKHINHRNFKISKSALNDRASILRKYADFVDATK